MIHSVTFKDIGIFIIDRNMSFASIITILLATGREIPFILMPYPIFKDSTGKELHFIGRDKVDLDEDKNVSGDVVAHEKIAQNRRRSLPVPSRKWIIDWKNNG